MNNLTKLLIILKVYIRETRINRMGIIDKIKEKLKKSDKKGKQIAESK